MLTRLIPYRLACQQYTAAEGNDSLVLGRLKSAYERSAANPSWKMSIGASKKLLSGVDNLTLDGRRELLQTFVSIPGFMEDSGESFVATARALPLLLKPTRVGAEFRGETPSLEGTQMPADQVTHRFIAPKDVAPVSVPARQGVFGECWLSCIAEADDETVDRAVQFVTPKSGPPEAKVTLFFPEALSDEDLRAPNVRDRLAQLCAQKDTGFREVVVQFPMAVAVDPNGGIHGTHAEDGRAHKITFIEYALAHLLGGYAQIEANLPGTGISLLTGKPNKAAKDELRRPTKLYDYVEEATAAGNIVGAGTIPELEKLVGYGLVPGHGHTFRTLDPDLLKAVKEKLPDKASSRWLVAKNPWGVEPKFGWLAELIAELGLDKGEIPVDPKVASNCFRDLEVGARR